MATIRWATVSATARSLLLVGALLSTGSCATAAPPARAYETRTVRTKSDLATCGALTVPEQERLSGALAQGPFTVHARTDVVLAWPLSAGPVEWYPESSVRSAHDAATLLNRAHVLLQQWLAYDPNQDWAVARAPTTRLVLMFDGLADFRFGDGRPYIALRDGVSPPWGSEDWFGWLFHELAHDLIHNHRQLSRVKDVWGEGLCDFLRHALLEALQMPSAAIRERARHLHGSPSHPYHGPARLLLRARESRGLSASQFMTWLLARLATSPDPHQAMSVHIGPPTW